MKIRAIIAALAACVASALSADAPKGYYDSCEGRSGQSLLSQLYSVVGDHTTVSYDGLWTVFKTSDVDANGRIWDMYSTKRWPTDSQHCGNYSNVGDCYNREHSFPKSWFNDAKPMYSDAFHLYPTDGKVNGQRSNYPYGECANGTTLSSHNGVDALGRLGKSTFSGYSGTVFEPDDQYKGDFARSYFYMAAAYNNRIASWDSEMLAGNSYPAFSPWALNLLLKWHRQDPVSQKEIDRNEAVYAHQHNRNPFIDHPDMVEHIWGNKQSQKWYANGDPTPVLIEPSDNATVDFGVTAVGFSESRIVVVRGTNLTKTINVSVTGDSFSTSTTSISAATANSRANLSITWRPTATGACHGTLTLSSDEVAVSVELVGEAVNGIPALAATNVTETSFTARWVDLGDDEFYTLSVMHEGECIDGFPFDVRADFEEFDIEDLTPGTTYTYSLSSSHNQSNVVTVTTVALIPSVDIISEPRIVLTAEPGETSDAAEVWIEVDNIDTPLVVRVNAPFELSYDHTNWSQSITLAPQEDRFYVRLAASDPGDYFSSIVITAGAYINDEATVEATVRDSSTPWFVEDFELADNGQFGTYSDYTYNGDVCDWLITNCGIFGNESADRRHGRFSVRLGNSATSAITSAQRKTNGIGTVTFFASKWSDSDGNVVIDVQYSADGDTWTTAGNITADETRLTEYSVFVNVEGDNFVRLQQTAGKRGNIDDITVSDKRSSGVDSVDNDANSWDAYCLDGAIVITNSGDSRTFMVYSVDGKTVAASPVRDYYTTLALPVGLYIVTDHVTSRRVVVK